MYLDANGDPAQKGEVSKFVQLLWEKGLQTERDYIACLGYDTVDDLQALSTRDAADQTLALMSGGARLIYQGVLISGDQVGRPDLLFRHDDGSSNFGAWYYEHVDIKAGKGWEERNGKRTHFKEHYAFQVLFYHDLAGQPDIRPGYSFPDVPTEIYFDIEDDPTQDVTYLFGMWIRRAGGEGAIEYILAERPADEKAACQRFWDFVAALGPRGACVP